MEYRAKKGTFIKAEAGLILMERWWVFSNTISILMAEKIRSPFEYVLLFQENMPSLIGSWKALTKTKKNTFHSFRHLNREEH